VAVAVQGEADRGVPGRGGDSFGICPAAIHSATFDVRTEQAVRSRCCSPQTDAVPVFDGVFLLRPQLNGAWDLGVFLEVDLQETLGCPTLDSRT
jgi:hypothetical protein